MAACSISIKDLPSVVVSHIFSFLPWMDKLKAAKAIPQWQGSLNSAGAWEHFTNSFYCHYRQFAQENEKEVYDQYKELVHQSETCMEQYGQYFQSCTLFLLPFGSSEFLETLGLGMLEKVSRFCVNLKHFAIYHPHAFAYPNKDSLPKYISHLVAVVVNCKSLKGISLLYMEYMSDGLGVRGISEVLTPLTSANVAQKLKRLEFKYPYDYTNPVDALVGFRNITHLKCPIQSLTTDIILKLSSYSLKHLHLLNDVSSENEDYCEPDELDWAIIGGNAPSLSVYYIFQNRDLCDEDLAPNPLVKSCVLDGLCIHRDLILRITTLYGDTMEIFAHLATERDDWKCQPYEDPEEVPYLYENMISHCKKLHTFICANYIQSEALILMAQKGKLAHLWVNQCVVYGADFHMAPGWTVDEQWLKSAAKDERTTQIIISELLGRKWHVMSDEEFETKTRHLTTFGS